MVKKVSKQRPNLITPTAGTTNSNYFAALDPDSSAYRDLAYLPNTTTIEEIYKDSNSMSSSTSTESSAMDLTKATLKALIKNIGDTYDQLFNNFTYTDIINFQTIMGNTLSNIVAPYKEFGYSYQVDTDET